MPDLLGGGKVQAGMITNRDAYNTLQVALASTFWDECAACHGWVNRLERYAEGYHTALRSGDLRLPCTKCDWSMHLDMSSFWLCRTGPKLAKCVHLPGTEAAIRRSLKVREQAHMSIPGVQLL